MVNIYIIKGPTVDGEELYWSNDWGWTSRDAATEFSDDEEINLPVEAVEKVYL